MPSVLIISGYYNKILQTGQLKQLTFSHNFGGWEVQDQGAGDSVFGDGIPPSLHMAAFLLCPYMVEREGSGFFLFLQGH